MLNLIYCIVERKSFYLILFLFAQLIEKLPLKNGTVTFKYKESKTNQWKIMTLQAEEFIRRFLQHVLPSGFVKVRYYGLFAVANRSMLSRVRMLFECDDIAPKKKTKNARHFKCPVCKKEMVVVIVIPRPAHRCNKAPPQMNGSFDNLSFNRCA